MSEAEQVVEIIREVKCWRLGNWDGCCCSTFSIRNVDVEISCGKRGEEQAVWISSRSMDYRDKEDLRPIMAEVIAQLKEGSGRSGIFAEHLGEPSPWAKPAGSAT